MNRTKKLIFTALCVSIGIILPIVFHPIPNAGMVFLPMHIPVLACGLLQGPVSGLVCGMLTPLLSSLLTGMPPAAKLPAMFCELATYGLVAGFLKEKLGKKKAMVYLSLVLAMICGRVVSGLVNGFIFQAGNYSLKVWLTVSFVTALPGIVIQILLVPALVFLLDNLSSR